MDVHTVPKIHEKRPAGPESLCLTMTMNGGAGQRLGNFLTLIGEDSEGLLLAGIGVDLGHPTVVERRSESSQNRSLANGAKFSISDREGGA